jgi:hypothetical protein
MDCALCEHLFVRLCEMVARADGRWTGQNWRRGSGNGVNGGGCRHWGVGSNGCCCWVRRQRGQEANCLLLLLLLVALLLVLLRVIMLLGGRWRQRGCGRRWQAAGGAERGGGARGSGATQQAAHQHRWVGKVHAELLVMWNAGRVHGQAGGAGHGRD